MTKPFEPISDATQAHVDRLVGSQLGDYKVVARHLEGRYGTLYRAEHATTGKPFTLEVLRASVTSNDEEARAVNAVKSPGIVPVLAFGDVPDGRRFRVMEPLEGQSLDAELILKGRFTPHDTIKVLKQVAEVLQAAHAWQIAHGKLGPSSVLRAGDGVKLIDFGLGKKNEPTSVDLHALGALGFALLTGKELEGAPPPLGVGIPDLLDRLLREFIEDRVPNATTAVRELDDLGATLTPLPAANAVLPKTTAAPKPSVSSATPAHAPAEKKRTGPIVAAGLVVVAAAGVAWLYLAHPTELGPTEQEQIFSQEDLDELEDDEPTAEAPTEVDGGAATTVAPPRPKRTTTGGNRKTVAAPIPSAESLQAQISKLENQLRAHPKAGTDLDAALFVLNKQRLRLTGSPTENDRRDVAKQLAGWKRSYLR